MSGLLQAAGRNQPLEPSVIENIPRGDSEIGQLGQMLGNMVATSHRRMAEPSMAYETGQDITASVEVDETLQAILDRVNDVVAYDAAEITLYDQDKDRLFVTTWRGQKGFAHTRGKGYRLGVGLTGTIAKERRSLLIGDALTGDYQAMPTGKTGILTLDSMVRGILGVPLIIRGRLVGTLELVSSQAGPLARTTSASWRRLLRRPLSPLIRLSRCGNESKSCRKRSRCCVSKSTRSRGSAK